MRIVLYSHTFIPVLGGLERNTATLARILVEQGHSVVVLTETPAASSDERFPFQVVRSSDARRWSAVVRRADLVLMNGGLAARLLVVVRFHSKPYGIVYQTHEGYRRGGKGVGAWIRDAFRKRLAERAHFNAFTSEYSRAQSALARSKTYTLLNPVDQDLLSSMPSWDRTASSSAPVVLFAGRVIEGKGVFTLADALWRLDGRHQAILRIVGDGPALPALQERMRGTTTIDAVFSGRLDGAELMQAYRDARVLVVPSTTHNEGNPLVIAEAISVGTPVIASNQPPMIESVGDAGETFPSGEVPALTMRIERILEDEEYAAELRRAALARAPLFSEAVYGSKLEQILTEAGFGTPRLAVT